MPQNLPAAAFLDELVTGALAIVDAAMRDAWLRDRLAHAAPGAAAWALDQLCQQTEQASPQAREVLMSVVRVLLGPGALPLVERLRDEAAAGSLLSLGRMLRWPSSHARPEDASEAILPDYGAGRSLTLGERKALARRPDRRKIDKLLRDPHPDVIRLLLNNPRLTEDDVLVIASKRPSRSDVQAELARHPRWSVRPRVRMALVLNPWTPPEIAVPMVCLLVRNELQLVLEMTDAQAPVRVAAMEILARRPPQLDDEPPQGFLQ